VCAVESLEPRRLLASPVEVLSYHNDPASSGQNLAESILTPINVNSSNFGKLASVALDGQVYAQPLYRANVNITRGSAQGIHDVLYVATQHASVYALDALTGAVLWKDTFLNVTDPTSSAATGGVTPVPASDTAGAGDVVPEIGILSTPVIDPAINVLYLCASTKEVRTEFSATNKHYVQRLWAINLSDGSAARSTVIADTIMNNTPSSFSGYQYVSGAWVNGSGNNAPVNDAGAHKSTNADGWAINPHDSTSVFAGTTPSASGRIAFNALLQMNRPAVTLANGNIYLGFASHGDMGPYYGWLLGYNAATLAPSGAFVTCTTFKDISGDSADYRAHAGLWMSGDRIASDGTYLYVTTGDGIFDESNSNFDANGFPIDHDYGDAVLKIALDSSSSQNNQNGNGWGLKVVDYFTPSNELELDYTDADLGSGGVMLIDSNAIPGHPHLLITGGKEGRVYLIDRDNMGKFNLSYPKNATTSPYPDPLLYDRVLGEAQSNPTNSQMHKTYGTASYFNGTFQIGLSNNPAWVFDLSSFATGTVPPQTATTTMSGVTSLDVGPHGETFSISANGSANGIYWSLGNSAGFNDDLQAYSASSFSGGASVSPIYDSNTNSARDRLLITGTTNSVGVKFSIPTVANGMVYAGVGSKNAGATTPQVGGIVIYGLLAPSLHAPAGLTAAATSSSSIHLSWDRTAGDQESVSRIERSIDNVNWNLIATVSNGTTSYDNTGLATNATYYYRVTEAYGSDSSSPSNSASATTFQPFAHLNGNMLIIDFDGLNHPVTLGVSGANLTVTQNGNTLSFTSASLATIQANGTGSSDALIVNAPVTQFTLLNTFDESDSLTVNAGNVLNFGSSSNHLGSLMLPGGAAVLGGNKVLIINSLAITPGGSLDLKKNSLIIPNGTLGTWNGSDYTGITGMARSNAIRSSSAQSGYTRIGVATAGNIFGIPGSQTGTFAGQTVDPSDVLVKFTYVGDANLDGKVNIDDYGRIDSNVGQSGLVFGWYAGDFNLDGKINIDDYGLIDSIVGAQGPVL
jgi:hypothetical protein